MKRICKQCGIEFELSDSEIQFYQSRNLNIPKRCQECRDKNKQGQRQAQIKNQTHKQEQVQNQEQVQTQEQRQAPKQEQVQTQEHKTTAPPNLSRKPFTYIIAAILVIAIALGSRLAGNEEPAVNDSYSEPQASELSFRSEKLREDHYQKHGIEMGFSSAMEYEAAAASVVQNKEALHKTEAEDGDDVYYLEQTNEFVIVSTDGYIRTYFEPEDGIDYYDRQ